MRNKTKLNAVSISMKRKSKNTTTLLKANTLTRGYYVVVNTGGADNVMAGDVVFKAVTAIWNLRTGDNLVLDKNIVYHKPSSVKIKWD